jgi:hypothetical protein
MNELRVVLDELAAEAPVEKSDWADVVARSRNVHGRPRIRKRLVLAVATAALLAVTGTAIGVSIDLLTQQEEFHARVPDDPKRVGPAVEVVSGNEWALIAWKSNVGICVDFAIPGNSPFGCGFPVRGAESANETGSPTHAVAGFYSGGNLVGGDGKATIFGVAAHDVARVTVELRNGQVIDATVYDAPAELKSRIRFFIVRLPLGQLERRPDDPVLAYNAYDRQGLLIERALD